MVRSARAAMGSWKAQMAATGVRPAFFRALTTAEASTVLAARLWAAAGRAEL